MLVPAVFRATKWATRNQTGAQTKGDTRDEGGIQIRIGGWRMKPELIPWWRKRKRYHPVELDPRVFHQPCAWKMALELGKEAGWVESVQEQAFHRSKQNSTQTKINKKL